MGSSGRILGPMGPMGPGPMGPGPMGNKSFGSPYAAPLPGESIFRIPTLKIQAFGGPKVSQNDPWGAESSQTDPWRDLPGYVQNAYFCKKLLFSYVFCRCPPRGPAGKGVSGIG